MRVALATVSFLPHVGGAEFVVHYLAQAWCRQGHDVVVINCTTDQAVAPGALYGVRRLPFLRGSTRFGHHRFPFAQYAVRHLRRLLAEFSPDLISVHPAYPGAIWLAMLDPVPQFIVTCHGNDITRQPWGHRVIRRIDTQLRDGMSSASAVVAISRHARRLIEELGVNAERIVDIPNGVDLRRFGKRCDFDLRAKLDLPRRPTLILSVGRNHAAKALDTALRAYARVARQDEHVHYLILGKGTDSLAGLAQELEISDRVTFHPGLIEDDLVAAYQQSDIYFSSSISETFPLTLLEAMAVGLPVVVTEVGGHEDVVVHETNGLLVPTSEIQSMADSLLRLLHDRSLQQALGSAARQTAQHYDWDRVSRLYLEYAMRSSSPCGSEASASADNDAYTAAVKPASIQK